ncbi:hypothetical protein [Ruthenibacterium lactatiformans]|nr:hypothetical protein [Ruthenibacterium lactatiformans]
MKICCELRLNEWESYAPEDITLWMIKMNDVYHLFCQFVLILMVSV